MANALRTFTNNNKGHKMKGKVLISGASGYVGSEIAKHLYEQGYEIVSLGRKKSGTFRNIQYSLGADIANQDLEPFDVLIHCAYDFTPLKWNEIKTQNIDSAEKLFSQATNCGIKKIILISSMSSFKDTKSTYGKAKQAIENHAIDYGGICIRPGVVWGRNSKGLVGTLNKVAGLPVLPIIGHQADIYTCLDQDLGILCDRLIETLKPESIYYAANPTPIKFSSLMKTLAKARNNKPIIIPIPWQPIYYSLKLLEIIFRKPIVFRSDSVVGLLAVDPNPNFSSTKELGLKQKIFGNI